MEDSDRNDEPIVNLDHDKEISIATASSRDAAKWRNQSLHVSEFVAKLRRTTRTPETVDEYTRLPKAEQDAIKDVGGFVGGLLKGGKRKKANVANRQLLTLDADFAKPDFVEQVRAVLPDTMWTAYSTHKHTESRPRLRLIVYPESPLHAEEYEAVMRKIADKLGIDQFDDTTYDINRLMYWPSTPNDGDYVCEHNDAPPLVAQDILDEYGGGDNWQDASIWPTSSRETRRLDKRIAKQADPLTKKGVVGAFCRTVSIYEALETHLTDVYKKEEDDRYSYLEGSTTKGLVVYDGKFAYSHHGTDPAYGQTCNAFDLIRLHKFGHLDEDAKEETPTHKLPSYREMEDWARSVDGVKRELVESGIEISAEEFDGFDDLAGNEPEGEEEDRQWLAELQVADDGSVKTTFLNATLILANDPRINRAMRFNEFAMVMENTKTGEEWTETDSYKLRIYVGRKYGCDFPENKIEQAIEKQAHDNAYHPVRDYLETLEWDGVPRVERLLIDYLGAEDNAYMREAAKCWMTAAVYRAMEPGFKFDYTLVLGGAQGIGKSSMASILSRGWYGELSSFDPKIAIEEITGSWIVEINELGANNRHEVEQQKAFLSATSTRVRLAYRRNAADYKRQCVFIGTTNQSEYLKDSTGNRRWWPVDCQVEEIDLEGLKENVEQMWAEAYYLYAMDAPVTLSDEARIIAQEQQHDKLEADPMEGMIVEWLDKPARTDRYDEDCRFDDLDNAITETRTRVCVMEIWQDCMKERGEPKPMDRRRIASVMDKVAGWERGSTMRFGERFGRQKGWKRDAPF